MNSDKLIPVLYKNKEECCGCSACFATCPVGAINMIEDEEGFLYPRIDKNECIRCLRCEGVCQFKSELKSNRIMNILVQFLGVKESGPVFSYELAKGFVNNGYNVYAIISSKIENKLKWEELLGDTRIYYADHMLNRRRPFSSTIEVIKDLYGIKRKFGNIKFDIAVRTWPWDYDFYYTRVLNCVKVVNYVHDPLPHSGVSEEEAKKNIIRNNKADYLVTMTESFVPIVKEVYKRSDNSIILSRHGLLPYMEDKIVSPPQFHEKERIHFLFFGRLDPYKGIDLLIDAYKRLCQAGYEAKLTIAGSGSCGESVGDVDLYPDLKIINRYIYEKEVDELFTTNNTVLVLPYKDATQSGVITIAYDYMIPVIATDTGGLREQLFDGKAGVLVEPNSVKALLDVLVAFVQDKELYNEYVDKMRRYKKLLDWNVISAQLVKDVEDKQDQ